MIVTARQADGRLRILGVLPNREKDTVLDFLRSIPKRLKRTIHTMCSDMYDDYTAAVQAVLPDARLVIDRFHVARAYRDGVDQLRKQELQHLKQTLSKEDYRQLKGVLWALRKAPKDLSAEQRQVLHRLFDYSPKLEQAYDLQQQLTAIFDQPLSQSQAKRRLSAWIQQVRQSGLTYFDAFLKTLTTWWESITAFFIGRANSDFVEGLNNKLKVFKRRCYGIFNLQHWFKRIFLNLEGYRLLGLA